MRSRRESGLLDVGYRPTARTRRQGRVPRAYPVGIGVATGGIASGAQLGITAWIVTMLVTVVALLIIVWAIESSRLRHFAARERDGSLLVGDVRYDVDVTGHLRDLNHRTADQIAEGEEWVGVSTFGTFDARPGALQFVAAKTAAQRKRATPAIDCEVPWSQVASAEVLPLKKRLSLVMLQTTTGARHRFEVFASADRVRAMLTRACVPGPAVTDPSEIRAGDHVRLPDDRTGEVVAVADRPGEPGHREVFVRRSDTGVESWDSSELEVPPAE